MKIIYKNDNGGVSVVHSTGELSIEEVAKISVPDGVLYQLVEDDSIPSDRAFRNAWDLGGSEVLIDITKAQEITKDRLRAERLPLLQAQDLAFQRKLEEGASTSEVVAEKQRLRDITQLVGGVTDLDALVGLSVEGFAK